MGRWLRNRYGDFLPIQYNENDIYIRSSDVDRTLMSAEANLAGLYPPKDKQVWDNQIPWQPIPVHTRPEKEDYLIAMKKTCPKYDLLKDELLKSKQFIDLNYKYRTLINYVSQHSGATITGFETLEYVYNTLFIENVNNLTLPDWTKSVFPDKLQPVAAFSFAIPCYTVELARLKTGPFFDELQKNIFNVTDSIKHQKHPRKVWMYSGHDTTIANILQALKLFEYHNPPYSSTILFEVRTRGAGQFYLNIYYKNSSEPRPMTLEGCDFDCPIEDFVRLLEPITLNVERWNKECQLSLFSMVETADKDQLIVVAGVLFISLLIFALLVKIIYSKYNKSDTLYLRLPDDDEQV